MFPPQNTAATVAVAAIGGVVSFVVASMAIRTAVRNRKLQADVARMEKTGRNVVHLLSFPPWALAPSVSAPCTKVEAFLRLAKIPYEFHGIWNTTVSPTECLPCVVHNGKRVAESTAIIEYLTTEFDVKMDRMLTTEQRAIGVCIGSLLEYDLRFAFYRTITGEGARYVMPYAARVIGLPWLIAKLFVQRLKSKISHVSRLAGLNLTKEQYDEEHLRNLETIESIIGCKAFLFGDQPSSLDCAVYAALLPIVMLKEAAQVSAPFAFVVQSEVLVGYVDRMTRAVFPDFEGVLRR